MAYALSIAQNNAAKHYRLKTIPGTSGKKQYYVAKKKFNSIPEMLDFFKRKYESVLRYSCDSCKMSLISDSSEGICCLLVGPPPKREPDRVELPPDVQKNWQEIPRKQIEIIGEIGKGNFGVVRKGKPVFVLLRWCTVYAMLTF